MPPTSFRGPQDPWNFANQQGDPNGNMSHDEAQAWAEAYAKQNPGWAGNNTFFIGPDGKAHDRSSWLSRNGWIIPLLVGTGVGAASLLGAGAAGASGAATGGAGASGGVGAAGAAGAATTGSVAAGGPTATLGLGGLSLPGGVGAAGAGAGATGAGAAGSSGLFGGSGAYNAAGNFTWGGAAGGNAAGIGAGGGTTAAGNFAGGTGANIFGGGAAGASSSTTGGSLMSKLLNPDNLKAAGRGIGALTQTAASNRGTELDAMMEADKMRLLMERDRRESETDLWKKLQAMNYVKSGGKKPSGPMRSASGRMIPQFSFGPSPISAADQRVASTLEQQLMQRLLNPPVARDYDSKMKPGKLERLGNWLGPIAGFAGDLFDKGE